MKEERIFNGEAAEKIAKNMPEDSYLYDLSLCT